jgi:hypothetical protein
MPFSLLLNQPKPFRFLNQPKQLGLLNQPKMIAHPSQLYRDGWECIPLARPAVAVVLALAVAFVLVLASRYPKASALGLIDRHKIGL